MEREVTCAAEHPGIWIRKSVHLKRDEMKRQKMHDMFQHEEGEEEGASGSHAANGQEDEEEEEHSCAFNTWHAVGKEEDEEELQGQTAAKTDEESDNETEQPMGCLDQTAFQEVSNHIESKKP